MTHSLTARVRTKDTTKGTSKGAGEFEAVASTPTLDRDGEVIAGRCFEPLPPMVPVHFFHDFSSPVAKGRPFYDGGTLKIAGTFASTPKAQEARTLVAEGILGYCSIAFLPKPEGWRTIDGQRTLTAGELISVDLVSVPSNREAAILSVRGLSRSEVWQARLMADQAAADQAAADLLALDVADLMAAEVGEFRAFIRDCRRVIRDYDLRRPQ